VYLCGKGCVLCYQALNVRTGYAGYTGGQFFGFGWFVLFCLVLSPPLSLCIFLSYFVIIFESVDLRSFFRPILSIRRSTLTLKFSLFVYHSLVSSISIKVVSLVLRKAIAQ